MLRRGHHPRRREFEFAPSEVPEVVRDQMFHAAGNRQFQDVVIRRIRQVGPPPEINRLPDGRRAEVVQQRLAFCRRDGDALPQAFPLDQFFIFGEQGRAHDGLVCPGQAPVQHLRARALRAAQGGDEDIGVLHDFHGSKMVSPVMPVKRVVWSVPAPNCGAVVLASDLGMGILQGALAGRSTGQGIPLSI